MDDRDDAIPEDVGGYRPNPEVIVVDLEDDEPEEEIPDILFEPEVVHEPEMIDLTGEDDDDDDLQIIEQPDNDQEMQESDDDDGVHDVFFGNDDEQEAVAAQQRADQNRMEEEERRQQLEAEDMSVEEDVQTDEEKREARRNGIEELLDWFIRLKPEHITKFESAGTNYEETFVADGPFLSPDICKQIAQEYKEKSSLEGLAEKYELADEALLIVAICIAVLDDNNQLDIDFTTLCIDRIDEWSMKKCATFFDKQGEGNKMTPLKFMQFTVTPPAYAILLLTIANAQENGYPCNFVPEDDFIDEQIMAIDPFEITNEIINTSIKYWKSEKSKGEAPTPMSKALDDLFHELESTSVEVREQHEAIISRKNAFLELRAEIPVVDVDEDEDMKDISFLSTPERQAFIKARAEHEALRAELETVANKCQEFYNRQSDLSKKLVLSKGDYCLARAVEIDECDLTYAVVQKMVDNFHYTVRFVDSNKDRTCHIKDIAMVNFMVHDPPLDNDGEVGLRVAVHYSGPHNQRQSRSSWVTGTVAGRRTTHRNDLLVFLDNGMDIYVTVPMKPGDSKYSYAAMKNDKRALHYQEVVTKMNASKMAVVVGQPLGKDGRFEKHQAFKYIRAQNRSNFVKDFMRAFPEWPMFKTPIGSTLFILPLNLNERLKRFVTVIGCDRAFAIVRYRKDQSVPGANCLDNPCTNPEHVHEDERIYRGSHRIEGTADKIRLLHSNNNLSGRKKHQIAAQFEPAEQERTMPQRNSSIQIIGKRVPSKPQVATKESELSKAEINLRIQNERKIIKTTVSTPVLPPLKDLPYHPECGPDCLRKMDEDPYHEKFHKNSPMHTPLMCGWRRSKFTMGSGKKRCNHKKIIVYFAPCGKPLHDMASISQYIRDTRSRLTVDCFSFEEELDTETFVTVEKEFVKENDFAHGQEGIPIPLINSVDDDPPPALQYSKRRFAYDSTVQLPSIQRDFCSGCSCEGDCENSLTCECQQLSAEDVARLPKALQYDGSEKLLPNYAYRNLRAKVITGLYECNDQCACNRRKCHNRVVQNNIKFPLHIFKTAQSGWGVRALTDIPEGAFICTYVGALLTNSIAEDLHNDDQYFADLDLQDSVIMSKNQVDNETDAGYGGEEDEDFDDEDYNSAEEDKPDLFDDDEAGPSHRTSTRRSTRQAKKPKRKSPPNKRKPEEPPKEEEVFKWDEYFDNSLYVVDAKIRGNLGRFLNHSCDPNTEVQHVLYDTHDLRLPWVAFFTTRNVKAGDELAWDYRYAESTDGDVRISCKCGAGNCRRRLL
ncbi:CBN-MET-2 protein [Caenorhabditis brenneri]|uniref:CBN-MET-2 protein n=1 Tax=Caenorhabditis brenneri TaxID=135651 RepID=G0ME01_CAEBE|nr:CBN-MET-2 protein [Caenorhabditis brenneri]